MDNELLLKSLNYSIGKSYFNLGIYTGIFKNSHLIFVDYKNTINLIYSKTIYSDVYDMIPTSIATNDEIQFIFERSKKFELNINTLISRSNRTNHKILINRVYD